MEDRLIFTEDRPREECGIFAVYDHEDAAKLTYFGLYALQHRGQESAGIVVTDGQHVVEHKAMGLVPDIFREDILQGLKGHTALGHVRYSTTGSSLLVNAQPLRVQHLGKTLAIAHNGNLVNAQAIRAKLESQGSIFQTTSDTEVIVHLIAQSREQTLPEAIADALRRDGHEVVLTREPGGTTSATRRASTPRIRAAAACRSCSNSARIASCSALAPPCSPIRQALSGCAPNRVKENHGLARTRCLC